MEQTPVATARPVPETAGKGGARPQRPATPEVRRPHLSPTRDEYEPKLTRSIRRQQEKLQDQRNRIRQEENRETQRFLTEQRNRAKSDQHQRLLKDSQAAVDEAKARFADQPRRPPTQGRRDAGYEAAFNATSADANDGQRPSTSAHARYEDRAAKAPQTLTIDELIEQQMAVDQYRDTGAPPPPQPQEPEAAAFVQTREPRDAAAPPPHHGEEEFLGDLNELIGPPTSSDENAGLAGQKDEEYVPPEGEDEL